MGARRGTGRVGNRSGKGRDAVKESRECRHTGGREKRGRGAEGVEGGREGGERQRCRGGGVRREIGKKRDGGR